MNSPADPADLNELKTQIEERYQEALRRAAEAADNDSLYAVKVAFTGKQGFLSQVMRQMGKLSATDKPVLGAVVNKVKQDFEIAYSARETALKKSAFDAQVNTQKIDVSWPGRALASGAKHPIHLIFEEVIGILSALGFRVRTGPQIEKDFYNFEALNIPADHPSRDMQDTFYIDKDFVLRTHTSPIQIHTLLKETPPFRALAPGAVYRCDADISHSPNFHQIEGLVVDEKVSMADLKGTIAFLLRELFGLDVKVRFRPSYFPFTEPSAEFDCSCPMCSGKGCRLCKFSGWIEIGGSGLVNPRVFEAVKMDAKKWQGYAFGFGIERMAIIKYGIDDIRLFYENDLRFLRQFDL